MGTDFVAWTDLSRRGRRRLNLFLIHRGSRVSPPEEGRGGSGRPDPDVGSIRQHRLIDTIFEQARYTEDR